MPSRSVGVTGSAPPSAASGRPPQPQAIRRAVVAKGLEQNRRIQRHLRERLAELVAERTNVEVLLLHLSTSELRTQTHQAGGGCRAAARSNTSGAARMAMDTTFTVSPHAPVLLSPEGVQMLLLQSLFPADLREFRWTESATRRLLQLVTHAGMPTANMQHFSPSEWLPIADAMNAVPPRTGSGPSRFSAFDCFLRLQQLQYPDSRVPLSTAESETLYRIVETQRADGGQCNWWQVSQLMESASGGVRRAPFSLAREYVVACAARERLSARLTRHAVKRERSPSTTTVEYPLRTAADVRHVILHYIFAAFLRYVGISSGHSLTVTWFAEALPRGESELLRRCLTALSELPRWITVEDSVRLLGASREALRDRIHTELLRRRVNVLDCNFSRVSSALFGQSMFSALCFHEAVQLAIRQRVFERARNQRQIPRLGIRPQ